MVQQIKKKKYSYIGNGYICLYIEDVISRDGEMQRRNEISSTRATTFNNAIRHDRSETITQNAVPAFSRKLRSAKFRFS